MARRATLAPKSKAENMAGSLGVGGAATQAIDTSMGRMNITSMVGLESLEVDEQTADDIINNVEKMITAEKNKDKIAKKDKKADEKTLDLTDIPGSGKEEAKGSKKVAATPAPEALARRGTTIEGSKKAGGLEEAEDEKEDDDDKFGVNALDQNLSLIRRKTIAIKSDNVENVLMSNINAITDSVANFQKMAEENSGDDLALQLQN